MIDTHDGASAPTSASHRNPTDLLAEVEEERDRRWEAGERVLAEKYLLSHQSLLEEEFAIQLVYGEFLLREQAGENPSVDEYQQRFPTLAARLARQVELHRALAVAPSEVSEAGTQIPDVPGFEILDELGRGGMAVVYRARDTRLNRIVALKFIKADSLPGREDVERFRGEAEAVARLHHPHIVQIFEVGEADGVPYMALEYVSGGTLADRLRENPLSPRVAAELTETLARALDVAHQGGIIHRDLKPANILLSGAGSQESGVGEEGQASPSMAPLVKIADFGLAKRIDAPDGHTHTGVLIGTPSYMSPEQASPRAKTIGLAVDVYALGAILYECLTGRPPFKESTLFETLAQVCTRDPIAPSKLLLRMPRDLEAVCLKCLEKDPRKRYLTAAALADDLRRWQDGKPTLARPVGPVSRSWKLVRRNPVISAAALIVAVALLAGALVAGWYQLKAIQAKGEQEATEIRLRAEAAAREAEVRAHALAEERAEVGRRANYARLLGVADRFWQGNSPTLADEALDDCPSDLRAWEWHFRRQRIHGSTLPAFRANYSDVWAVAVSFDGTLLATGVGDPDDPDKPGVVQLWDMATGNRLAEFKDHTGPVTSVAFSRDGKTLVSASRRVDIRGMALSQLPAFHDLRGEVIAWDVETRKQRFTLDGVAGPIALSADGTRLAACALGRLARMWDITGEKWVELPALPAYSGRLVALALSPDGKKLAISGIDITSIESGRPVGPEVFAVYEVATGRKTPTSPEYRDTVMGVIFSPDGEMLFAACLGGVVRQWDLTTGRQGQQLRGHNNTVTGMAFSRDGQRLATASLDQAVKLWEPKEGVELRTYRGHDRVATSVAFGPPGDSSELLVSAGADGVVRVWDARSDPESMELRGHHGLIHAVAFSPDRPLVASVSSLKPEARVWDVSTGKQVAVLPARAERLAFGPDGLLATAGGFPADQPGELLLWDVAKQSARHVLAGHKRFVTAIAFSRDGRWLASAGGNPLTEEAEDVCIWDVATGKEQLRFRPSVGMVRALAFSPNGQHLAIGGLAGAMVICARDTGRELKRFVNDPGSIYTVAYAPDGKTIASGDNGGFVTLWEVDSGLELLRVRGHSAAVSAVSFDKTGKRLASASFDLINTGHGEVRLWDTHDGREVLELPGETFVAFSSDGRRLAAPARGGALGMTGIVRVWDAPPSHLQGTMRLPLLSVPRGTVGHGQSATDALGKIPAVAIDPKGQVIASSSLADGTITLWDRSTHRPKQFLTGHTGAVPGLAFSPDGTHLASASQDHSVRLWDLETGKETKRFEEHTEWVAKVLFDPTGTRLISASHDKTVRVWSIETGQTVLRLDHPDKVLHAALDSAGRWIATACLDGVIRIWDAQTGRMLHEFHPAGRSLGVAFGPGLLAAAGADGVIRLWDPESGQERGELMGHMGNVWSVAFAPGGILLSAGADQVVRVWDVAQHKELELYRGHLEMIRALALSDGWFATASYDGTVRLWDLPAVKP